MRCAAIALLSSASQVGFERLQAAHSQRGRDQPQVEKTLETCRFRFETEGEGFEPSRDRAGP
jgi:hypothetical protein